ncbi:MAG TPA: dicarboxylate/amino acid:cation symporter [Treponema sp.]|nr:dicarboxylate/amino acid:cation symporter [Treponema sp.]
MKIWLKYLIGIVIGLITVFIIPLDSVQSQAVLDFIVEMVLRFGRYTLLPLLFFSVATAVFKLRDEKLIVKTGLWTFGVIIASSLLLVALGLLTALIVHLPRIPITIEKASEIPTIDVRDLLRRLFPYTGFEALIDGAYLLPCFVFAGLAGAGAASDKIVSKPAVTLFDSLSKVCYIVMSLFTEFLAIGMIALMTRWAFNFKNIIAAGVYTPLIIMLTVDLILVAAVIYPLILRFLCHEPHPYRVLYASITSFLVSFISGDTNLTLLLNMRHGAESLGIRRRINAVSFPLFSIFGRGGAALVEAVCFVLILRSYIPLPISVTDILWIGGVALLLSFVQSGLPSGGAFIAITVMCVMYGRGFEAGYLLLKDAAPLLCCFAAGFDAFTAIFGSYIVGVKTRMVIHQEIHKFI